MIQEKLTETNRKVYELLGEEMCKKLDDVLGKKTLNMTPIISFLKKQRIFHLWKNEKYTVKEIADDVRLTEVRVYQILNGC